MKLERCICIMFGIGLACLPMGVSASSSSWLVDRSPTGLEYTGYANEGQTNAVNTIPDFSRAGYKGGGVAIPFVPAAYTLSDDGPADDTARIQNAINTVSALPIGPDGFRGAVLLKAGEYTVGSTLTIAKSGVVIRGEGSQESGGTRITFTAVVQDNLFEVNGSTSISQVGSSTRITDAFVPVGAKTFQVADASGFTPGDRIQIVNTVNQEWIYDLHAEAYWSPDQFQLTHRRVVTAVNGNQITIDAPVVQTIEDQYGGGEIYRYSSSALENIGFEALRLESTYASETDDYHGWIAIRISGLSDGWVRQVTSRYFAYSCVTIADRGHQITVEDCAQLDPKSVITGGHRYSFGFDDSQQLLFQRCLTRSGRHDFVSGSKAPGPNAFVDCRADNAYADTGPHLKYATGQIYDNVMVNPAAADAGGELKVRNTGGSHAWTGAQILFWNSEARTIICDAPQGAMNWSVGCVGVKSENDADETPEEPFGIFDSHNMPVRLRSLFYAQLEDRLGANALNNVILPQQKTGNIRDELHAWDGDGLFGDEVVVWADEETVVLTNQPLSVRGIVRNLQMLDRGVTAAWSRLSGPGSVSFGDSGALETTATFSQPGSYVLQLIVDDGVSPAGNTITIEVGDEGPDTTPPAMLTGLAAVAGQSFVALDWYNSWETDVIGYNVYRRTGAGSYGSPLVTGLASSDYFDDTVVNGTTYYYMVTAVDAGDNESVPSAEISALPDWDTTPPAVPAGLQAASGNAYVLLNWPDNDEWDFAGYNVYRSTTSGSYGGPLVTGLTSSEYVDETVVNGTTYYYVVTASDVYGNESSGSIQASASPYDFTPAADDFDFGTDPGKTTPSAAGFTVYDEQGICIFTDLTDGFEMQTEGFNNVGFLKAFDGLGGGLVNDFRLTAEVRVNELVGTGKENNDRWGIRLFGNAGSEDADIDGLACLIVAQGDSTIGAPEPAFITIRNGVNGPDIISSGWVGGPIAQGDNLRLVVEGTYLSMTELELSFSVSRIDGSDSQNITTRRVPSDLFYGDLFGASLRIKNSRAIEYDTFSAEVLLDPPPSATELFDFGTDPGKSTPEEFGFTKSTPAATETWSDEADSVRYRNQDTGTQNASLLKAFTLDRSDGSSYTFEGVVHLTDGYADDNNRVGIYLFGDNADVTAEGGGDEENEAGALYLRINLDGSSVDIHEGLDFDSLASTGKTGSLLGGNLFGTDLAFTADIDFVEVGGVLYIDVLFSLTDANDVVTTVSTTVLAADFTGDYFGFATRCRSRNYGVPGDPRSAPFVMDYRRFSYTDHSAPVLQGYDLWASGWGTPIGPGTQDYELDGLDNWVEYALGGNPTLDDAADILPEWGMGFDDGTNWLYYTYDRRQDAAAVGLTYTVMSGASLMDSDLSNAVPAWSVSPATNGYENVIHRMSTDTAPGGFMQLNLEYQE